LKTLADNERVPPLVSAERRLDLSLFNPILFKLGRGVLLAFSWRCRVCRVSGTLTSGTRAYQVPQDFPA
jgi:hypothetical protein